MKEYSKYESYNARYMSFEDVAASFIPNKEYEELLGNNHSLLMGPRGCGKTTLLKMLTPRALYAWKDKNGESLRNNIPFWGIYIPADTQWKCELDNFFASFKGFEDFSLLISRELVNTNILNSLCKTFNDIVETHSNESIDRLKKEAELAKELSIIFNIKSPISPRFDFINQALLRRITEINRLVNLIKFKKTDLSKIEYPDYFHSNYFDLVNQACVVFEEIYKNDELISTRPFRWALCFDELEIAPSWLQMELLKSLRSRDQKFIFKLTTSPLISLYDEISKTKYQIEGRENDDYTIVRNWVYNNIGSKKWVTFCDTLVRSIIEKKVGRPVDPELIFGKYDIDRSFIIGEPNKFKNSANKKTHEVGSVTWIIIREMAEYDNDLHSFLLRKGLNPLDPSTKERSKQDTALRKMKPIVLYRYYFKKESGLRSRKVVALHFGLPYIYELCDGNPRALINLINQLLTKLKINDLGEIEEIPITAQSRVIEDFSKGQLERISNHPDANLTIDSKIYNIGNVLKSIGIYFNQKLVQERFRINPIGCFRLDDGVNRGMIKLLKLALNQGAIQYLDPREGFTEERLTRKRFRLSYLLNPSFFLPKREYETINLSTIFDDSHFSDEQLDLF